MPRAHHPLAAVLRLITLSFALLTALPLAAQDELVYRSSFENNEVLNVFVDPALVPLIESQPGFDGGAPRPLALLQSEFDDGDGVHFVENEIYLITDDPQDLAAFQGRWPSAVLVDVDLDVFDNGATQDRMYLLTVDASAADPAQIRQQLEGRLPTLVGDYTVSSEAALRLLALAASEVGEHGLRVGINPVLQNDSIARRNMQEAVSGDDITAGSLSFPYARNSFAWPFAKREDQFPSSYSFPLNTGAAEAVRVVGAGGRLSRTVRVMIADAGFFPNEDYPPYDIVGGLRGSNPVGCGEGIPAPGSVCATHGTHVAMTGFARNDNAFGTFGPGGEVSELLLLQSPSLDLAGFVHYVSGAIGAFTADPPDIINISASESIPGGWCFLACEPLDLLIGILRSSGIAVVASAGNDSYDVDATDRFCFGGCAEFEEGAVIPCELDGVVCVGASNSFQSIRTGYSNFGSSGGDGNSVDLYAPGNLYSIDAVNADETNPMPDDQLQIITGTSFAAPYAAGVLALTFASDPSQTATEAVDCLLDTAFQPFPTQPAVRSLNAVGAVSCALGGSHPFVDIVSPSEGRTLQRGTELLRMVANADDYEQGTSLTVRWTSSRDGELGTTAPGTELTENMFGLQLGNHQICAQVVDASARSTQDCVNITIDSSPPSATILQPTSFSNIFFSSSISLSASTSDLDGPDPSGANVRWYLYPAGASQGASVATGLNATLPGGTRSPGTYTLLLEVTDSDGVTVERSRTIYIVDDPPNLPPEVTITEPSNEDPPRPYEGTPVRVFIVATVEDPEDGSIPFSAIDWFMGINGSPAQPLNVETFQICFPGPFGPVCSPATYYVDLVPAGSSTSTRFDIKATVRDSGGRLNESNNGRVSVVITQLI